jgi:EAL domain-containing protein (putative c-di-GMP-specific phosphodiesterase class I)
MHWTNAEIAALAPDKLSAAAEAAGLLVPINTKVLQAACEACAAWQRAGVRAVPVAVSVATGQINDHAFVAEVGNTLRKAGLEPGMLELQVAEHVLFYDSSRAAPTMAALKSLGVRLAIEAFGSGKASFADLRRFPLDTLNLHSSRVDGAAFELDKQRYIEGVSALSQALRLKIVATGVASESDAQFLRGNGCAALQGLIAPQSLAAGDCEALLRLHG